MHYTRIITISILMILGGAGCDIAQPVDTEQLLPQRESPIPDETNNPWLNYQAVEDHIKEKSHTLLEEQRIALRDDQLQEQIKPARAAILNQLKENQQQDREEQRQPGAASIVQPEQISPPALDNTAPQTNEPVPNTRSLSFLEKLSQRRAEQTKEIEEDTSPASDNTAAVEEENIEAEEPEVTAPAIPDTHVNTQHAASQQDTDAVQQENAATSNNAPIENPPTEEPDAAAPAVPDPEVQTQDAASQQNANAVEQENTAASNDAPIENPPAEEPEAAAPAIPDPLPEANVPDPVVPEAAPAFTLAACTMSLEQIFSEEGMDAPGRDSNPALASLATKQNVIASIQAALRNDMESAASSATAGNYQFCHIHDNEILVWYPQTAGTGLPSLAVRQGNARAINIQIPHPLFEAHTLEQGLIALRDLNAQALIASGRHRCASLAYSQCSGQTAVCDGDDAPFRASDPAHNPATLFHMMSERIRLAYPHHGNINIHGMSQDGISLSNGTKEAVAEDSRLARIYQSLQQAFPEENITTCNPHGEAIVDERYCGTTNTQGRASNGSANACSTRADQASDTFFHLEQSRSLRDNHRRAVLEAIVNVF